MNDFHSGLNFSLTLRQIQMINCLIIFSFYISQHPQVTKYWEFQKQASQDFYCRKAAWIIQSILNEIFSHNLKLLLFVCHLILLAELH